MVAQRRFAPLVVLLFAGLLVLLARSFEVQVLEHEIWAGQAANMLRSSRVIPFHRGRILDREGRVLVRDEDTYQVEFCYRDFRRGHPLAQVAHARSTLSMQPVSLRETLDHWEAWAAELVTLSPVDVATLVQASPVDPDPQRASDLRFYIAALLDLTPKERKALGKEERGSANHLSYLESAAALRGTDAKQEIERLTAKIARSRASLALLAERMSQDLELWSRPPDPASGGDRPHARPGTNALIELVDILDAHRDRIDDEAADALFERAAGFGPGRISTDSLETIFDLGWIARALHWDAARLAEWTRSRRPEYERELETVLVPHILARVALVDEPELRCARLLDEIAELYRPEEERRTARADAPTPWTDLESVCVLSEVDSLFDAAHGASVRDLERNALALQDREIAAVAPELADPWLALGMAAEVAGATRADHAARPRAEAVAERWRKLASTNVGLESKAAREELAAFVGDLERRFLSACELALEDCAASAESGDSITLPLAISRERLDRALEEERFILKDKSNRPLALRGRPSYELVHALSRYADLYPGFDVRDTTTRVAVARTDDGLPLAHALIGRLRRPSLRELFGQVEEQRRLVELTYKLVRTERDQREIEELNARLFHADEWTADSGVEDYFERELRGRHGFRESLSLESRAAGAPSIARAPVDGLDVELTLDADLQAAAQATLAHPETPNDPLADHLWIANPVGAIALITPEGEILVAASEPTESGHPRTPGRDGQRAEVRERTFRRPTFNPPGSVFKPFVAAYAIDRLGFDPARRFVCASLPDGGFGYREMHCHGSHADLDLHHALSASCNAYFAQLGEIYTPDEILEMAAVFGIGESTGVRHLGTAGRSGLGEDWRLGQAGELAKRLGDRQKRMQFTNGLSLIEATPMQIARATAALVTGRLPELRIARKIGATPVPHASRSLGIDDEALRFVREAMRSVVRSPGGTAYDKGLDEASLGFTFACKTGSADTEPFRDTPELTAGDRRAMQLGKMRKHTWVAGWFPADDPKAILVVYLHDMAETASHTSVYVAAQFLKHPAVRRFVEASRAAVSSEGDAR